MERLGAALGAESTALLLTVQGRPTQSWQTGQLPGRAVFPPLQSPQLERMRTGRVYSQLDLPGTQATGAPLRALRCAVGSDGFAALILRRRDRDFRAADAAQLSRLSPYLGAAVAGWRALVHERSRAALDRQMGQDLGAFWLRLTASGRVSDMAAGLPDRLLSLPALRLQPNGWLEFSDPATALAFRQAIAAAQTGSAPSAMVDLSRDPPLQMILRKDTLADARGLVAVLRQAPLARSLPLDQVAVYFGLSRRESRLAILLCDGFSLRAAAAELGWTIETTRSCSKQVFARLGVSGQAGVLRKLQTSAVWLTQP